MKKFVPNATFWFANYAGRLLLTVSVLFIFLCALGLVMKVHAAFLASKARLHNQSVYVGNNIRPAPSDSAVRPFWPEFPRNTPGIIQSAIINGVQIITENWETTASTEKIFSYYREQMLARGWRDVTEEAFSLQPELRGQEMAKNDPQDEQYVNNYRKVMDSNLVLSRGKWTMHIMADPSTKGFEQNAVKIYAAATPSIEDLWGGMESALAKVPGRPNQPLDAVQRSGGDRYHTTIVAKNETPVRAFQEALAKLGAQGWKPVAFLPKQQTASGNFVWLVRGREYAVLSAKALPQGKSSSVMVTEVTPAKQ